MKSPIVQSEAGITLAGGGPFGKRDLALCLARAPVAVAADSGADRLLRLGVMPAAVIGDFDSISAVAQRKIPAKDQYLVAEQSTTDFDKALRLVSAPFVLALGFAGARLDHGLAAMHSLVRHPGQRCLLIGPRDLAFAAPARLELSLTPGDPLSLFPMAPVTGRSQGLEWPIDGLPFSPAGQIGTSNRVLERRVTLEFDAPGMLVILPRRRLDTAIRSLLPEVGRSAAHGG